MPESNRAVTARTRLDSELADFLDSRAEAAETTRSEVLRRLVNHYCDADESGLECPHCKNPIEIDL